MLIGLLYPDHQSTAIEAVLCIKAQPIFNTAPTEEGFLGMSPQLPSPTILLHEESNPNSIEYSRKSIGGVSDYRAL
jgi:hypothetical protein